MAKLETAAVATQIPGILQFDRRKPRLPHASKEGLLPHLQVTELKLGEVKDFTAVMQRATMATQGVTEDERAEAADKRNVEFYINAIDNPKSTVLVARDASGKIVGGLHGEESHDDEDRILGQKVGYVRFVGRDPESTAKGVGQSLYAAYKEQLIGMGATVMAAAVDYSNLASHKFHEREGMEFVALQKTPQPTGETDESVDPKWMSKLGKLPGNKWIFNTIAPIEGELPVIETDYLPFAMDAVTVMAAVAMDRQGLGKLRINKVPGEKRGEDSLYNIIAENRETREDFQVIVEASIAAMVDGGDWAEVQSVANRAVEVRAYRKSVIQG